MRRLLFCLLLCPAAFPALAQRQGRQFIDSLTAEIPRTKAPHDQAVLLYALGKAFLSVNIDSALHYSHEALRLAQKANWQKGQAKSYNLIGLNLFYKGDYIGASHYYDTAMDLSQKIHDSINWNMTLLNKGAVLNVQGKYPQAMQYFVKCLAMDEKLHDNSNKAIALQNVSNVYMQLKDTTRALDYSGLAYTAYQAVGNLQGMDLSLYTRGAIYDSQGKDSLALDYYQQSGRICEKINDKDGEVRALNGQGNLYLKKDDLVHALTDFSRGLTLSRELGNQYEIAVLELNAGNIYLQAIIDKKYNLPAAGETTPVDKRSAYLHSAHDYLFQALTINQQEKFDALKDNYLDISRLDSLAGNYRGALTAFQQYSLLKDSTFNTENRQTIQELEDKHQLDLRDQQIRINQLELTDNQLAISRQKTQRWMYIGGILLLGAIGGLLFRQSRLRKKANTALQQLNKELDHANQVKTRLFGVLSHDLRSPISNLVSFLNLQKDNPEMLEPAQAERHQQQITRSAGNLLDTMEDLLLWSKEQMRRFSPQPRLIPISDLFAEMRRIYPDNDYYRMDFDCPPDLALHTDEHFLKTILRNLSTNAIKAVTAAPQGHIRWTAWTADNTTFLSVTDNGPGISGQARATLLSEDSPASNNRLGLHLVRDFAAAIGCRITINSSPGEGSTFTLAFT